MAWLLRVDTRRLIRGFWVGAIVGATLCGLDLTADSSGGEVLRSVVGLWTRSPLSIAIVAGIYGSIGAAVCILSSWTFGPERALRWSYGVTMGGLTAVHLVSLFLKLSVGDFLTLGAVEFCLLSPHACASEILGGRVWALALVGFGGSSMGLLASLGIAAPVPVGACSWRLPLKNVALGTLCFSALTLHSAWQRVLRGESGANVELALLSSIWEDPDEAGEGETTSGTPEPALARLSPRRGPPQSAHGEWLSNAAVGSSSPNVLLLLLESVPSRKVGYEGYTRPVTPNLDRLAKDSVRFRRAWTTATHSNYAQMAVLSSLFPRRRVGLDMYRRLDYPRFLFHDVFAVLGYQTGTFSSQDERWQGMRDFQRTSTRTHYFHAPDYPGEKFGHGHGQVISDGVTASRAIEWIQDKVNARWALYVNFQATHFPYYHQPGALHRFAPSDVEARKFSYLKYPADMRAVAGNRYDNALLWVDSQVGALRDALERTGQLENTLWVITSDHGELFGEHELVTHGRTLFDAEARVPFIMHWPRNLTPMDVYQPVSTLDVLPSILAAMDVPPHPSFQGTARVGRDRTSGEGGIFMNIQGLRTAEAIVCWPWKAIVLRPSRRIQLFDLGADPGELHDRAEAEPQRAQLLGRALRAHIAAQMAYHRRGAPDLKSRYAPRLADCPRLPGEGADANPPVPEPEVR